MDMQILPFCEMNKARLIINVALEA